MKFINTKQKPLFYVFLLTFLTPLVFSPFLYTIFELPKLAYFQLIVTILLLGFLVILWKYDHLKLNFNKYVYLVLGLWFLSLILSTVLSQAPQLSFFGSYTKFQGFISHLFYLIYFLIALQFLKKPKDIKTVFKIISVVGFIVAAYAILQKLGLDFFDEQTKEGFLGRSFSSMGHPNYLGQFLIYPIFTTIYFLKDSKSIRNLKKSWPYLVGIILLVAALFFTENRATFLALAITLTFYALFRADLRFRYKFLIASLVLALFVTLIISYFPSVRSINIRLLLWEDSLELLKNIPIFGSGLETFKQIYPSVFSLELFQYEDLYNVPSNAHNEALDISLMQGLYGFFVYIISIIVITYFAFKKREKLLRNRFLQIATFAFLAHFITNLFSYSLTVHNIFFYTFIAIILLKTVHFEKIKINKNLFSIFITGILTVLLLFNIVNFGKAIYADYKFNKGVENYYANELEKSVKDVVQAVSLNPNQEEMHFIAGEIFYNVGKSLDDGSEFFNNAELLLEQAGKFLNYDFRYYIKLGMVKSAAKEYREGENLLIKGLQLAPNNPLLLKELGLMYCEEGNKLQCIAILEKFLAVTPKYWQWKNELEKRPIEDRERYRIFFKITPDYWDIFPPLIEALNATGQTKKAKNYLELIT